MVVKKIVFAIVCILLLCSFEKKNIVLTDNEYAGQIRRGLKSMLSQIDSKVEVGIEIVSLKNGQVLYTKNQNALFNPASCVKLFTAASALGILGPSFYFETTLSLDEKNNLYVRGSGDPEFSLANLESMIDQLFLHHVNVIENIILDTSAFDDVYEAPGILRHSDDNESSLYSKLGALNINHNCGNVWVLPTKKEETPRVVIAPLASDLKIQNLAKTSEKGLQLRVSKNETLSLLGNIGLDQEATHYFIPVDDPHQYFGRLVQETVQKKGITIKGKVLQGETPKQAKKIATHKSSALPMLLFPMLKYSDMAGHVM